MMIIQIAGRLGRDPESRFTSSGQKVTTLTVATNVRKGGKDETVWWRVTVWGERFDKMIQHLKKGSAVIVVGEMHKPEIWTDKEGRPQVGVEMTAEIIRFSPFGNPDKQQEQQQSHHTPSHTQQQSSNNNFGIDSGFGDYSSGAQNYGTAPYGVTAGLGQEDSAFSSASSEEQVPF